VNRKGPDGRSFLWMTLLLSLALHLVFLAWVQPTMSRPPMQVQALPDLAFYGQSSGESRALYSPVLFALPTPMGFSASMLNQSLHSDPPIREQSDARSLLQVEDRIAVLPAPQVFPPSHYQTEQAFGRVPPISPSGIGRAGLPGQVLGMSVRVDGDPVFRKRVPTEWAEIPEAGKEPWMAMFRVELDKDSRVRRVFMLERPARGPGADMLVRWMYSQVFQPGLVTSGRVAVRWVPPVGEAGS